MAYSDLDTSLALPSKPAARRVPTLPLVPVAKRLCAEVRLHVYTLAPSRGEAPLTVLCLGLLVGWNVAG